MKEPTIDIMVIIALAVSIGIITICSIQGYNLSYDQAKVYYTKDVEKTANEMFTYWKECYPVDRRINER